MGVQRLPIVRRTERAWITMGRMFNVEVFNQTISGSGSGSAPTFYTGQEHTAMLGSADSLLAQVTMEGTTDVTGTLTVTYQFCNTGRQEDWQDAVNSATVSAGSATAIPKTTMYLISSGSELGAFGRYKVSFNKGESVTVRIVVCGRTQS